MVLECCPDDRLSIAPPSLCILCGSAQRRCNLVNLRGRLTYPVPARQSSIQQSASLLGNLSSAYLSGDAGSFNALQPILIATLRPS